LLVELVHLLALPGHLGLQAPNFFLALTDLRGKPGSHVLGLNLQLPLLLNLTQETVDLSMGVGTLLASRVTLCAESHYDQEQLVPLLS
jgi:hypothetical protein